MTGLSFLVLLASCRRATWNAQVVSADAEQGNLVSISCTGSQNLCYQGAAQACPGGFDIADSTGQAYSTPMRNTYTGQYMGTRHDYSGSLLVRCRPARAEARAE